MNKFLEILLLCILSASVNVGQRVYFAESYTERGEPIGAKNEWHITPEGSYIFILLETDNYFKPGDILYLYIDEKKQDTYEPFDSKSIIIEESRNWAVYNYKFTEAGEYEAYFITPELSRLAGEKIKIKFRENLSSQKTTPVSSYYDDCKIIFSRQILLGGEPLGETTAISLGENSSAIYVHIINKKPMNTSKLLADIWRKKNRTFDYDEFVESKKFSIDSEWNDTYFKYIFKEPGEYKFSIYTEREIIIKTGYFTVN